MIAPSVAPCLLSRQRPVLRSRLEHAAAKPDDALGLVRVPGHVRFVPFTRGNVPLQNRSNVV
eukprot:6173748-Prymnesium_polylepis.2